MPFEVFDGLGYQGRFKVIGELGREREFLDWFVDVVARTSDYLGGTGNGMGSSGRGQVCWVLGQEVGQL